jgi:3-deoxy-D-manno-octulosonic-acid transferase
VFVGGSLVPIGGHNILEPAVYGKPIVFGPHMQNFAEIAETFLAGRAAVQVGTARELEDALIELLSEPEARRLLGDRARALVEANRGARERSLAAIAELLPLPAAAGNVVAFPAVR